MANIAQGYRKTTKDYRLCFRKAGSYSYLTFPCNSNGDVDVYGLTPEDRKNYWDCIRAKGDYDINEGVTSRVYSCWEPEKISPVELPLNP